MDQGYTVETWNKNLNESTCGLWLNEYDYVFMPFFEEDIISRPLIGDKARMDLEAY